MVPTIVAYYNFNELEEDAKKVERPWVCLKQEQNCTAVGLIDTNLDVSIKVIFKDRNFIPAIVRYGKQN